MPHRAPSIPPRPPPVEAIGWTDGQVEALKWAALASMLLDHVGRLWLDYPPSSWVFAGGRLAFPLFAIVLGLNLARPGDQAARAARTTRRLALWCAVSVLPSVLARGHPALVNVLGTLGLGAALCWAFAAAPPPAVAASLFAAVLAASWQVEFGLAGVLLVPMAWLALTRRAPEAPWLVLLLVVLLGLLNQRTGGWPALAMTLAALPLLVLVRRLPLRLPRLGRAYYAFYPLHLGLIGLYKPLL